MSERVVKRRLVGKLVVTSRRVTTVEQTSITPGGHLLVADPRGGNPRMYAQDGSMIARDGRTIRNPRVKAPSWWRTPSSPGSGV